MYSFIVQKCPIISWSVEKDCGEGRFNATDFVSKFGT